MISGLLRAAAPLALCALIAASCSSGAGDAEVDDSPSASDSVTTATAGAGVDEAGGDNPTTLPTDGPWADAELWMCRPGLPEDDNVCRRDLDTTAVSADGSTAVETFERAEDPAVDCFYVYPTISGDPTANSDLVPDEGQEIRAVLNQSARFGSVCEVWAPVYRQRTLTAMTGGVEVPEGVNPTDVAYADVEDAFDQYLSESGDRPFVVVGHSQGAGLLNRLLQERVDDDPALRKRLVSALLIGSAVRVPEGADVGGDFDNIPLCGEVGQTGCVVTYASFRSTSPPPPTSFFGRPRTGEGVAGCTNPALLAGGDGELHSYFEAGVGGTSPWAPGGEAEPIETPFFSLPGMVSAQCVSVEGFNYLELTVHGDPADPRADDIGGDLTPEWGMHLVDVNVAMGDLVALVGEQIEVVTG